MAAEIHSRSPRGPVLLTKIPGHREHVTSACLIPREDGVITASEDRTLRVWLKRDSGQYWPSIYHTMSSPCSALAYHHDSRKVFVGLDSGAIVEFLISDDFNKMNFVKTYPAHQNRVTEVIFSPDPEWVISTGQDKFITWMCTQSGSLVGRHAFSSWASCLQYDEDTKYAFVGDFSGQVTLLKLEDNACSVISTLKGHEGSISCLYWDPVQRYLFSGSSDQSIILWDIGGRQGRTIILQGHHDKVQGLCYLQLTRQLVSCSVDGGICVWNMDIDREEAPQWLESDSCQTCAQPFFWNIKQMWDTRSIGLRQHHCRKCGKAVCGKCSSKRSSYPIMGFEFQVRVCDSCYEAIKDEDRTSLATFHEGKHNICFMTMDISRGLMATCGTDRLVKIWDMTPTVGCSLATGFSPR
ncbi:WD repeat and FYVE domain-containing protein 1 isoform X1 [Mixophyes fleayi]|uniref:WD repeat and FYVE domain-containing protein 1 isoform X1 n=2 Tax=Mixophyes fleayi TaxID=3061075 RepID=UPI003F4D8889